ncbi:MAG: septum site-determining protein MinC [Thermoflexales bacterium]|nr:septum site-determining protein MinC [Thermoflexales bacterium]
MRDQEHVDPVVIKGTREGLVITLGGERWSNQLSLLEDKLQAMSAFFKGARVALIVGPQRLSEDDIRAARDLLLKYDVALWALVSNEIHTRQAAAALGLDTSLAPRQPSPGSAPPIASPAVEATPDAGLVIRRTLRSGQSVRHTGAIIVIGDVHSGAELIAGGDVVVWGKLHGTVHAGAFGDEEAVVCALDLMPMQLRIGRQISRSPDDRRRKVVPEMACVTNGRIEAVAWNPKGRAGLW